MSAASERAWRGSALRVPEILTTPVPEILTT